MAKRGGKTRQQRDAEKREETMLANVAPATQDGLRAAIRLAIAAHYKIDLAQFDADAAAMGRLDLIAKYGNEAVQKLAKK